MPASASPILVGFDLFASQTPGTSIDLTLIDGCLAPQSPLALEGVPLLPTLGDTDTIVERLAGSGAPFDPPAGAVTVPIELVALHLVSAAPVDLTCLAGPPAADLHLTINKGGIIAGLPQPDPLAPSLGSMEIFHDLGPGPGDDFGGSLDSCFGEMPEPGHPACAALGVVGGGVFADAIFTVPGGDPAVPGDLVSTSPAPKVALSSAGGTWLHVPPPGYPLDPGFPSGSFFVHALPHVGPHAVEPASSALAATKVDSLVGASDADADAEVDPGERLQYEIEVSTGADAAGVEVTDTITDPNLTFVPGSVRVSPLARDDAYDAFGNTQLTVPAGTGILANDSEFLGETIGTNPGTETVIQTTGGIATTAGGTVTLAADGSFVYDPPLGFEGVDTFTYTLVDPGGLTGDGLVSFTVDGLVWFIDNSVAGGPGNGTSADPFRTLAEWNGANGGAPGTPQVAHTVYLREGTGLYDGGIVLLGDQELIGQGEDLVVDHVNLGPTTLETATVDPTVTHSAGDGIALASGNTVRGLTVSNSAGANVAGNAINSGDFENVTVSGGTSAGIDLVNPSGTFTFDALTPLSNATGSAIEITGGTASIDVLGSITSTGGSAVTVTNHATGTLTFQGAVNATGGDGLQFSNADGTYDFQGATTLAGGDAGIDILAGSSGTFTFANSTITNPTNAAFLLNASNPTSVAYTGSITKNNASRAVDVDGHTGGPITFSGGTISQAHASGNGIRINASPGNVVFNSAVDLGTMATRNAAGVDILGNSAGTFTFADLDVFTNGPNPALRVDHTVASGTLNVTTSRLDALGGPAIDVELVALNLVSVSPIAESSATNGLRFDQVTGTVTLQDTFGPIDVNSSTNAGISISGSSAGFTIARTDVDNGAGPGISLSSNSGTTTFSNGLTVDTTSGTGFSATGGGTVNVADVGNLTTVATTTGRAVDIQNVTANVGFDGVTVTNGGSTGINLSTNTGTIGLGTVNLTMNNQTGLFASNSGTVNSTGGTIAAGSGTGVDIDSTTLGVTLTSVSSSTGANVGIDLQTTTGSFTVAGDGGTTNNGSGGSIHTKTGNAIFLSNATNVSLNRMDLGLAGALSNVADNCVRADQVNGFTLTRSNLRNCASLDAAAPNEAALFATSPTGTWLVDNVVMERSFEDHFRIENDNGTLTQLTVSNSRFSDNNDSGSGDDSILYRGDNGSMGTLIIQSNIFEDTDGDHVQVALNGTASANVTIGGANLADGNTMRVNGGEVVLGSGITFSSGQGAGATNFSGLLTFLVQNNDIDGAEAGSINVNLSATSTAGLRYTGTVSDNIIGATGVGGSGGFGGIQITTNGAGTATAVVEDNQVRSWDGDSALRLTARDGSNRLNATVRDNVFLEPTVSGTTETAIEVASGATAGDTSVVCLDLSDAAVDGNAANNFDVPVDPTFGDMFFGTLHGGSVLLAGYTGAADDFTGGCPGPNSITCHVQGANTGAPSVTDFTFGGSVSGAATTACQ